MMIEFPRRPYGRLLFRCYFTREPPFGDLSYSEEAKWESIFLFFCGFGLGWAALRDRKFIGPRWMKKAGGIGVFAKNDHKKSLGR